MISDHPVYYNTTAIADNVRAKYIKYNSTYTTLYILYQNYFFFLSARATLIISVDSRVSFL